MSLTSFVRAATLGLIVSYATLQQANPPHNGPVDLVEVVRPAVVQVVVEITSFGHPNSVPLPQTVQECFHPNGAVCIVGTGFFVNSDGDVATASHVATAIQQIIQVLGASNISANAMIGVSIPNIETKNLTISSSAQLFQVTLTAIDTEHDIAVFHTTINPFTNMPQTFSGSGTAGLPQTKASFLRLTSVRPRDGEEVFACGFPFGVPGLVTTSGEIASAWKTEKLSTSKNDMPVDIYWVDLRINPGNSGGPIFRMRDHAVLGMAVEAQGSLGFAVPAKYIVEFLRAHNVPWVSADTH